MVNSSYVHVHMEEEDGLHALSHVRRDKPAWVHILASEGTPVRVALMAIAEAAALPPVPSFLSLPSPCPFSTPDPRLPVVLHLCSRAG